MSGMRKVSSNYQVYDELSTYGRRKCQGNGTEAQESRREGNSSVMYIQEKIV